MIEMLYTYFAPTVASHWNLKCDYKDQGTRPLIFKFLINLNSYIRLLATLSGRSALEDGKATPEKRLDHSMTYGGKHTPKAHVRLQFE